MQLYLPSKLVEVLDGNPNSRFQYNQSPSRVLPSQHLHSFNSCADAVSLPTCALATHLPEPSELLQNGHVVQHGSPCLERLIRRASEAH